MKAHRLYNKFIADRMSKFYITITDDTRAQINNLMQDKDRWLQGDYSLEELLGLFENCCMELFEQMLHCFYRFQQTPKYQEISVHL